MLVGAQLQLAILQLPGSISPPAPLLPRFNLQGVVCVVDVVPDLTYGTKPSVGKAFALLINEPFQYTSVPLQALTLEFVSPSGKHQLSDNRYLRVGERSVLELEQFSTPKWLLYQAGTGEFIEPGVWQVNVHAGVALSSAFFFTVTNA